MLLLKKLLSRVKALETKRVTGEHSSDALTKDLQLSTRFYIPICLNALSNNIRMRSKLIGFGLLLSVVVLWLGRSTVIQEIFKENEKTYKDSLNHRNSVKLLY